MGLYWSNNPDGNFMGNVDMNPTEYPMKCPDCHSMCIMEKGKVFSKDPIKKTLTRPMKCKTCDYQWHEVFIFNRWSVRKLD